MKILFRLFLTFRRGAVKTLIDWYVRRRRRRCCRNAAPPPPLSSGTVCGRNGWLLAVDVGSSSGAMCMPQKQLKEGCCCCCPAEKPSESPITARPILESCRRRRPLFFYIHVSHFEICSTFSAAWLDILSACVFPRHTPSLLVRCMEICIFLLTMS